MACGGAEPDVRLRQLTTLAGDEVTPIFSPDGHHLAFSNENGGRQSVWIADLATGGLTEVVSEGLDPSWSPDGDQLAYQASPVAGVRSIRAVELASGGSRNLSPVGLDAFRPLWAPSADLIAFTVEGPSGRQVWLWSFEDGAARPLTSPPAGHIAYGWSPDGQSVLTISFAPEAQDVVAWRVDSGTPRRFTDSVGEEWWPTWSPRGDRVAFYTTYDDLMTDIWMSDVATGELSRITDFEGEDFLPSWSPDGEWLAFSSDRISKSGLWIQHADNGTTRALATEGRAGNRLPTWSPDGRTLAFSYLTAHTRLYRISRHGGEARPITPDDRNVVEATVSADGRRVAYESDNAGSEADLFVLELESGETLRLTDETAYNARPSWSPDGSTLALERSSGGGPRTTDVSIIPADGGESVRITHTGYVRSPVWCGGEIVFTVANAFTASEPDQIWIVSPETREARQLTVSPGNKRTTDCSPDGRVVYHVTVDRERRLRTARLSADGDLSEPLDLGPGEGGRWSPDGMEIAFLSSRDGQPDLYIVSADGGAVTRVTETPVRESWPDWLEGSSELVFSANMGGRDIWLAGLPASWLEGSR